MDWLPSIISGFQIAFQPGNFLYCFIGVFIGTLIGVLPGIGPGGTIAILLPITFGISPVSAIIMLSGIYYGAMYGGSTTAILVNIPGESSSVVTCLDGYQMAKKGRAGPALGISAFGSFIGATFCVIILMFLVYPLAQAALRFGPPEYFSLMCLGLTLVTYLATGSFIKAVLMALFGLLLSTVGIDIISGIPRFYYGSATLLDGIGIVPLSMGFFGINEVLTNIEAPVERVIFKTKIGSLLPNLEDWKRSTWPIIRGTLLGFPLGVLPGGGGTIASFVSYSLEKRVSKHPEEFGKGAIEGVAGPETANNAGAVGAYVPLFALGIPPNVVLAILVGAFMMHGLTPGPRIIIDHPEIFWGTVASMYLGNIMLLALNLPLIGIWVKILKVPYRVLMPLIILCCIVGVYSVNYNIWDIVIMVICGFIGYILTKFGYEGAPLMLAYVLGPMMEQAFRQSLIISKGSFSIFLVRPISVACLILGAFLIISSGLSYYRKAKSIVQEG